MSIAAFFYGLITFMGGPSLSEFGHWMVRDVRPEMVSMVRDSDRRKLVKKVFKEMSKDLKKLNKKTRLTTEEFHKLVFDFFSSKEDFEALLSRMRENREEFISGAVEKVGVLKSLVSQQEWQNAAIQIPTGE